MNTRQPVPHQVIESARRGCLYPAVILHGGGEAERRAAVVELARALLCAAAPEARPCGDCRHCRRIEWAGAEAPFHPDFLVLERDLKTATSVDATKELLRVAQVSPFEARGQVFVLASAESLSGEAANALLKVLEEPPASAPRHFLLLAPSRLDLLPTLRSRSLSVFLGGAETADPAAVARAARAFGAAVAAWSASRAPVYLLSAAEALLGDAKLWEDPRAGRPWATAAAAVVAASAEAAERRRLLGLAEALLEAQPWRLRGIPPERILEGLVARHLGSS